MHTTALHQAVRCNQLTAARSMLRHGLSATAKDAYGRMPLHLAPSAEMAQLLIELGAPVNARDGIGNTPLHLASTIAVALTLIEAGADIDAMNFDGLEPGDMGHEHTAHAVAIIREERDAECRVRFRLRPALARAFYPLPNHTY